MKKYVDILGSVSPTMRSSKRVADIVAALAPPPTKVKGDEAQGASSAALAPAAGSASNAVVKVVPTAMVKTTDTEAIKKHALALTPGILGGAAGAIVWKKHRMLGFLAGHAVAANAYPIIRGTHDERKAALCQLGVEAAGIGGALLMRKKAWQYQVLGWFGGVAAGVAATSFIPGSPVSDAYGRLKMDWKKGSK